MSILIPKAGSIANDSSVAGTTIKDALETLKAADATLAAADVTLQNNIDAIVTAAWTSIATSTSVGTSTTKVIASLPSGYRRFVIRLTGVSHDNGTSRALTLELSSNGGGAYGTAFNMTSARAAADAISGVIEIDAVGDTGLAKIIDASLAVATGSTSVGQGAYDLTTTGVIDTIRLGWNGAGNFDAGTYTVHGIK